MSEICQGVYGKQDFNVNRICYYRVSDFDKEAYGRCVSVCLM